MELTVVIPTRDRSAVLCETLARLEPQRSDVLFEVIVVDDRSADGTGRAVARLTAEHSYSLTLLENPGSGPAAARNRALAAARAPVCLFIDDDSWPRPDLLERHRDFHRGRPDREAALLGRIEIPSSPAPTPFMSWLAGLHIDYEGIDDPQDAGGDHFFTGNVSAKTAFLRDAGGFDERFTTHEDIDLGLRLERQGMRLAYDSRAIVEHYSPMDLPMAIDRMRRVGRSLALLTADHAGYPVPRRPGARHRVKAGALTCLAAMGARTPRLQRETWRFLCHEATREGYWSVVDDGARAQDPPAAGVRIGTALARLASRDEDARMPASGPAVS